MSEELKDCCMGCRPASPDECECECECECGSGSGSSCISYCPADPETKEVNNYVRYFESERDILIKKCPDHVLNHAMISCDTEIKSILKKIDDGWSGMSAPYYIRAFSEMFKNILSFKPLSPLTFDDDEWNKTYKDEDGNIHYQNNRMSSVFKDVDKNGKVSISDIDAVYHTSPFKFDMATDEYFEDKKYGDMGWSGVVFIFIPEKDEFIAMNGPEIRNMDNYIGLYQNQKIKAIEVFDSSNTHSDYEFHLSIFDAIPKDFFKDYKLTSLTEKDWIKDTLKIINTTKWKEFIKKHGNDLLK